MNEEQFVLVYDNQRKCLYLTLADQLKNTEGLKVVEKFPNAARAMDALQKYSKEKVFGKMKLTDAIAGLNPHSPNDGEYAKPLMKQVGEGYYDDPQDYLSSAKGQMINLARAEQELENHGIHPDTPEWEEFEKTFGKRLQIGKIKAQELLQWLGY